MRVALCLNVVNLLICFICVYLFTCIKYLLEISYSIPKLSISNLGWVADRGKVSFFKKGKGDGVSLLVASTHTPVILGLLPAAAGAPAVDIEP